MKTSIEDIIVDIATNKSDGATALAERGLDALEILAKSFTHDDPQKALIELTSLAMKINRLRPSMAAIGAQVAIVVAKSSALISEGAAPSAAILETIGKEREILGQANVSISSHTVKKIGKGGVFVSCSWSMTVMHSLMALKPQKVYFGEGQQIQDGLKAAGWLSARGCNVEVVPDCALPTIVENAKAVLVGADQILVDGSIINRCSTFSLALAANYFQVPFWVLSQRIKLCGFNDVEIEEVKGFIREIPDDVTVRSPLFDKTPPSLISGVVTESGIHTSTEAGEIGTAIASLRRKFFG